MIKPASLVAPIIRETVNIFVHLLIYKPKTRLGSTSGELMVTVPLNLSLVSTPVGLVFVGTVAVGGVIWYIYQDQHHRKFRSRRAPSGTVDTENHEQYEEKLSINDNGLRCEEIADEETLRTGRKWRVKRNAPLRGTGLLYTKKKLQWECIITDAPKESEK